MNKKLVAYFSCSGTTKELAEVIADKVGGDLFEIEPKEAYTEEDLDYNNENSRCTVEMSDMSSRPEVGEVVENFSDYDTIYVGYPIWWGKAPTIINSFLESYDLDGKTVIPFATYHSSGIGESDKYLEPSCEGANYVSAKGFSMNYTDDEVDEWLNIE